jgi:hypothetical protein
MDALQKEKRELDAQLKANRAELRRARERERAELQASRRLWHLTPAMERTALIVYVLAEYDATPAVRFLAKVAKQKGWPVKVDHELRDMVEALFVASDPADVAGFADTGMPTDPSAMREALSLLEEWRLSAWVKGLNEEQGVAPSTERVLHRLEEQRLRLPEAVRPVARGGSASASARMWASRWRRRWGGRFSKLRAREDVALEELRAKVGGGGRRNSWGLGGAKIPPP